MNYLTSFFILAIFVALLFSFIYGMLINSDPFKRFKRIFVFFFDLVFFLAAILAVGSGISLNRGNFCFFIPISAYALVRFYFIR